MQPTPTCPAPERAPTPVGTRPPARPRDRHGRRTRVLVGALLAVAALALSGCMNGDQQHAFDLVNATRARNGLPALAHDNTAQTKAQQWAEHLATRNHLAHSRLADGMDDQWRRLGENVGYGSSIDDVHGRYLGSDQHRANVLDGGFTHLGVGVASAHGHTFTVHVYVQR